MYDADVAALGHSYLETMANIDRLRPPNRSSSDTGIPPYAYVASSSAQGFASIGAPDAILNDAPEENSFQMDE